MIRKHENSVSWKAGFLAFAVHAGLIGALLISFNWKAAHPIANVTEVELWDKLPAPSLTPSVTRLPPKIEQKPIIKEEPKPEPKPEPIVKETPKPEEAKTEAPKADIELEKKKKEALIKKEKEQEKELEEKKLLEEKKVVEKQKKDEDKKKLLAAMRDEDLQNNAAEKKAEKERKNALKRLQQEALTDEKGESDKQASAASASEIGAFKAKIQAKIKGNVNKTLCGDGNPELRFEIGLLPTGELAGTPKITKSSGIAACDDAVERAIAASQPLPLPSDPNLFTSFRNLNLKFKPND